MSMVTLPSVHATESLGHHSHAISGVALSFVAQRTKSTWPGIVGHSFGNLVFFLSLVN
jgi:membrane protease YdiL (CAAX protease family)